MTDRPPLLHEASPAFSAELISLLDTEGHTDLATRAHNLAVVEQCPCEDDFCQSFYTAPRRDGAYAVPVTATSRFTPATA